VSGHGTRRLRRSLRRLAVGFSISVEANSRSFKPRIGGHTRRRTGKATRRRNRLSVMS
jgi:hypothetical protein